MRDFVKRPHDGGEAARRQHERVAAGDDDLPDLRPLADIGVGPFQRRRLQHRRLLADRLAAKAEATIDRTQQGRLQQHPVAMTMHDARNRRPALVADRVGQFLFGDGKFRRARHKLRRDRIMIVAGIDQRRHVLSDGDREFLRHPPDLVEPSRFDKTGCSKVFFTERQRRFSMSGNEQGWREIASLRSQ